MSTPLIPKFRVHLTDGRTLHGLMTPAVRLRFEDETGLAISIFGDPEKIRERHLWTLAHIALQRQGDIPADMTVEGLVDIGLAIEQVDETVVPVPLDVSAAAPE